MIRRTATIPSWHRKSRRRNRAIDRAVSDHVLASSSSIEIELQGCEVQKTDDDDYQRYRTTGHEARLTRPLTVTAMATANGQDQNRERPDCNNRLHRAREQIGCIVDCKKYQRVLCPVLDSTPYGGGQYVHLVDPEACCQPRDEDRGFPDGELVPGQPGR